MGNCRAARSKMLRLISVVSIAGLLLSGVGRWSARSARAQDEPPPPTPVPGPERVPEPEDPRNTTGPTAPEAVRQAGLDYVRGAASQLVAGVPAYLWHNGCAPTAAGMVIGYWDGHGYDWLIPGSAATQTASVDEAMASHAGLQNHWTDYSLPLDTEPAPIQPDKSELPAGDEHISNSIADFMGTSFSARGNHYGITNYSGVRPGLTGYFNLMNPGGYTMTTTGSLWSELGSTAMWAVLTTEVNAGRPMVFLVDSDGNGNSDHFITVIGYDDTSGTKMYAAYNTWDDDVHWYEFGPLSETRAWGVARAVTARPSVAGQVLLVDDDDNLPNVQSYYSGPLNALGVSYDVWDTGNTDDEPTSDDLAGHAAVIWFTGHEYSTYTGPGTSGTSALASYLGGGGCLLMSSQNWHYYRGLTTFMTNFFGVSSVTDDALQTSVTGTGSVFSGLGPYTLNYSLFANHTPSMTPDGSAEAAFQGSTGSAAIDQHTASHRTAYLGFPVESLPNAAARERVLGRFLLKCGVPAVAGVASDFDGDKHTDPVKFDSTNTAWWLRSSDAVWDGEYLGPGTYVRRSDFDGDLRADPAKFDATNSLWYVESSSSTLRSLYIGPGTYTFVAGSDYDGDEQSDPAQFNTTVNALWYYGSSDSTWHGIYLGPGTYTYVAGSDFDGDHQSDPAHFASSNNVLWYRQSTDSTWHGVYLGPGTFDYIEACDFDGDLMSDGATFSAATNTLWYRSSRTGAWTGVWMGGTPLSYVPAVDFDGDSMTDPAGFDAAAHLLWYLPSGGGGWTTHDMGAGTYTIVN